MDSAAVPALAADIDRMIDYAEKAHADKNQANYAYSSDILKNVSLGPKGAKGSKGTKYSK